MKFRRPSLWVKPRIFTRHGAVTLGHIDFFSDEARQHTRFVAVSDWGYVFRWINDCPISDFEMVAWWYLRDYLDCGLRWRVLVRWPGDSDLLELEQLYFNIGFSIEEQDDFYRRVEDSEEFCLRIRRMKRHFLYCFYHAKTMTKRSEVLRFFAEYLDQTEWIKEKLPVPRKVVSQGRPSLPRLKLKLPSTCLLLEQSGTTSRYVCLGFRSSDSMCRTFMSASPTERASILRRKGTSTLKLV